MRYLRWISVLALAAACGDGQPVGSGPPPEDTPAAARLVAGFEHTCALDRNDALWCWGNNEYGQLNLAPERQPRPARVPDVPQPLARIGASRLETCALDAAGVIRCWGWRGAFAPQGGGFSALWFGYGGHCALAADGTTHCWGGDAVLSTGAADQLAAAAGVSISAVSIGGGHRCILSVQGAAYCAGASTEGQLGNGSFEPGPVTQVRAPAGVTFKSLSAGLYHTCALSTTGQAYCWGGNGYGELGDGTQTSRAVPTPVQQPAGVTFATIASGWSHTCATTVQGDVYCWGSSISGQLGNGSKVSARPAPTRAHLPSGVRIASLALGVHHTCAMARSGEVYCWGGNGRGQLGDGTFTERPTPVAVFGT